MTLATLLFLAAFAALGFFAFKFLSAERQKWVFFDEFDFDEEEDDLGFGAEYDEDDEEIDAYVLGLDNLDEDALEDAIAAMNAGRRNADRAALADEQPELFTAQ